MDSVDVIGDQRSTIAYDKETDRLYFTTKGGYLYSLKLKSDGTFDKDTLKSVQPGNMSTSTPVVYNGRIYIGVTSGSNFSGTYSISVIDAATMTEIYKAPLKGYPQCSVLLSTAYEKEDGSVYLYATYNNNPGGITLIRDKKGQTTPDVEEIFIPEKARQQYCITSIICDENGTLYYKNDSACVMAVASSEAYMTGVTSSAEGSTIDNGVAFDGKLSSHDIVVLTSADKTTLTFTASEGSSITIDGVEGNSREMELTEAGKSFDVVVKKGSDERTYKFTLKREKPNTNLKELYVSDSNQFNMGLVSLTPAFSKTNHVYHAEYSTTRRFLNIWTAAEDTGSTYKLYPVSAVGKSTVISSSEGNIIRTATNSGHDRYAIYFADNSDCATVRIEVTAKDGKTKDSYYVTLKQQTGNAPVISAEEGAGVRKSATSASVTFTANEYGTLYYKVLPETETAPESIDTTGEGIQVEVGENTLELTDITDAAYKVYMVLKDSDSTPKTSEMLTVRVASVEELLAPAKEAAITELNVYKNAEDYRDAEKTQITKILANAKVLINNAKTAEEIAEQLSDAKADLDKLKTSAELAADEKTQTDADAVKALIEALGDVTLEKKESVEAARNAYDALSTDAKKLVSNYDVLVQAEKSIQTLEAKKQQEELKNQMDAAAAASISNAITAIGEVTLDKRGVVEAARAAYDTLTDDQKVLVTNYTDLTAAESRIAELVKEATDKAEADKAEQERQEALKAKAQPVIDAIAAIGEVTLNSEKAITAARSAYEALEADVKEKVTNLSDLVIAEKDLAALKAEKKAAEDLKAQQEEAKRQQEEKQKAFEEAQKAQDAKLKEQEEKLKAEKDKYGFNEKTTLKSAKVKGKKVTLKWNKVKGASGYEIYCKTGKGKWKLVKTLNKGSKASYKLKGKAGKKYTYKVRVFQKVENKVIYGQYSNTKSAKIKK